MMFVERMPSGLELRQCINVSASKVTRVSWKNWSISGSIFGMVLSKMVESLRGIEIQWIFVEELRQ